MSRPSRVFGTPSINRNFSTSPLKSSPLASPPIIASIETKSHSLHPPTLKRIDSPPSSSELSLNESVSSSTSDDITVVGVSSPLGDMEGLRSGLESELSTDIASDSGNYVINEINATTNNNPVDESTNELNDFSELPRSSPINIPSDGLPSESSSALPSPPLPLSCPICGDSMVSLLQLNRHLDDSHSENISQENEQLKSWFSKKFEQAKQIQKTLFDDSASEKSVQVKRSQQIAADSVPRTHWKNHGTGPNGRDRCSYPTCDNILNSRNGAIHCRQCGQLFCREHTLYQMKLSLKDAKHDPNNGVWCRVCEPCYTSRIGYTNTEGVVRDISQEFSQLRQKHIDVNELEVNKLEKRLIRLIRALADLDEGLFTYTTSLRRKSIEHEVSVWQHDKDVQNCPICSQRFSYSLRKHHCRVCGKIVCADLGTDCSRDVPLSVLSNKLDDGTNELPRRDDIGIRICKDCKRTIFAKKNFYFEINNEEKSDILKIYDSMMRVKYSIDTTLPRFQQMLIEVNNVDNPPSHEFLQEASSIRRKLLTSFSQYDSMARKVLTCEVSKETDKRLQRQIYQVAAQFLQENMLPLKALPKVLKHQKNGSIASVGSGSESIESASSKDTPIEVSPEPIPAPLPTPSLSEVEIQSFREQLIVLEEQKFMVENMINEAKITRKFDQVIPLEQNLGDLNKEIDKIKNSLGSYTIT